MPNFTDRIALTGLSLNPYIDKHLTSGNSRISTCFGYQYESRILDINVRCERASDILIIFTYVKGWHSKPKRGVLDVVVVQLTHCSTHVGSLEW